MCVCLFVHHVRWQMDGWTPLLIASQEGHAECVRVLLGEGAAINQATVGSTCPLQPLLGCARDDLQGPACVWLYCA